MALPVQEQVPGGGEVKMRLGQGGKSVPATESIPSLLWVLPEARAGQLVSDFDFCNFNLY